MLNNIFHSVPPSRGSVNFIWAQLYTVVDRGDVLRALGRDEEAIRAYEESLRLDPLHLDVYTDISTMRFKKRNSQTVATILHQAVQAFPTCAKLHIYHAYQVAI